MIELVGLFIARLIVKLTLIQRWLTEDHDPMQGDLSDTYPPTGEHDHEEN